MTRDERTVDPVRLRVDPGTLKKKQGAQQEGRRIRRGEEEEMARKRREQEQMPVFPADVESMLDATVGDAEQGVLNKLQVRFAHHDRILDLLLQVEDRMLRYLTTETPDGEFDISIYAEGLLAATTDPTTSKSTLETAKELQTYIVGELNPLLKQLHEEIHDVVQEDDPLYSDDGFLRALSLGEVDFQTTVSAFGLLQKLGTLEGVPSFNLENVEYKRDIVVTNPLNPKNAPYWQERLDHTEIYGTATLPELIGRRSETARYELRQAIENIEGIQPLMDRLRIDVMTDDTENILERIQLNEKEIDQWTEKEQRVLQTAMDYLTLDWWMGKEAENFTSTMTTEQLSHTQSRLHFAKGGADELFNVLNAAEGVKQHNPELYVRLAGIGPGQDYATKEAKKSDLYGNVFQIGLYRSLHLDAGQQAIGASFFNRRVQGLTEINRTQRDLLNLSEEEMAELEKGFEDLQRDIVEHPDTAIIPSVMFAYLGPHYEAMALRKMLEEVAIEQREEILRSLNDGDPDEFFIAFKSIPEFMIDDEDVEEIFQRRFGKSPFSSAKHLYSYISTPFALGGDLAEARELIKEQKVLLWETIPKEKLLSYKFFKHLKQLARDIEVETKTGGFFSMQVPERDDEKIHELVQSQYLDIVKAHPEISREEWIAWYKHMQEKNGDNINDNEPWRKFFIQEAPGYISVEKVFETINSTLTSEDVIHNRISLVTKKGRKKEWDSWYEEEDLHARLVKFFLYNFYALEKSKKFHNWFNETRSLWNRSDEFLRGPLNEFLAQLNWSDRRDLIKNSLVQGNNFLDNFDFEVMIHDLPKEAIEDIIVTLIKELERYNQIDKRWGIHINRFHPWPLQWLNLAEKMHLEHEEYVYARKKMFDVIARVEPYESGVGMYFYWDPKQRRKEDDGSYSDETHGKIYLEPFSKKEWKFKTFDHVENVVREGKLINPGHHGMIEEWDD